MIFVGDQSLHVKGLLDADFTVEGMLTEVAGPTATAPSAPTNDYVLFWQDGGLLLLSDTVGVSAAATPWLADELFLQRAVAVSGSVSSALTVTTTAAGSVAVSTGASSALTVTASAAGSAGTASGSSLPLTYTTTAAGTVAVSTGAASALTVTTTAAGATGVSTGAASSLTATLTAAGTVTSGLSSGSAFSGTVTFTASGTVTSGAMSAGASASLACSFAAAGSVSVAAIFFSAPPASHKRGRRYGMQDSWWLPNTVGVTVYRKGGTWYAQESPPPWDLEGADRVYLGGRTYQITPAEESDLVAAGFSSGIYYG